MLARRSKRQSQSGRHPGSLRRAFRSGPRWGAALAYLMVRKLVRSSDTSTNQRCRMRSAHNVWIRGPDKRLPKSRYEYTTKKPETILCPARRLLLTSDSVNQTVCQLLVAFPSHETLLTLGARGACRLPRHAQHRGVDHAVWCLAGRVLDRRGRRCRRHGLDTHGVAPRSSDTGHRQGLNAAGTAHGSDAG